MTAQELHDRTCVKKISPASVLKLDSRGFKDRSKEIDMNITNNLGGR